ncbi:hypothetical protein ACEV7Y_00040 [Vibrio parahaemolyticus]|uniref:hypothetical protein n=1 Tax=Vibrio vulnificus TaxID=672 RepID=UPI00102C239F|nr:hypothetical protein [Vibrio vulnificus]EHH2488008.1 hypothetical protein [Vibrio vulnificus]RZR40981.1 hypothetical protein D8T58_21310 [Vibrio vulnificus]
MSAEIKILHQLCHNEIFEVVSLSMSDMKAWMASSKYLLATPLVKTTTKGGRDITNKFKLQVNDVDSLYIAMANDCNRFAQAAVESMWSINKNTNLPKSAGWTTVKMYYASFYAAHAILRLYGRSCSQYEKEHIEKVHELSVVTAMDNNVSSIENGFYLSSINKTSKEVEYSKLKDSHADTWHSFSLLLDELLNHLPTETTGLAKNKDKAFTLLANLKQALIRPNAHRGNWPSQVRNKIHYQHTNGAWFPYMGASHNPDDISRNSRWVSQPNSFAIADKPTDVIGTLSNVSNCMVSLMHHLLVYGNERTENRSAIFRNGYIKLVNQLCP